MKIVKPITIDPTQYQAYQAGSYGYSNATDYALWNIATAYVVGDKVIVESLQSQFQCVVNNTGTAPTITGTTPWIRIGATNAWRPFDKVISAPFIGYLHAPSGHDIDHNYFEITGVLQRFDTVAILETNADYVIVTITDQNGDTVFFADYQGVDTSSIIDAWSYCFGDVPVQTNYVFDGFSAWGTGTGSFQTGCSILIKCFVTGSTSTTPLQVGEIVIGQSSDIGDCKADVTKRLIDYSKKEADAFGNISIVQRAYSYEATFDVRIPASRKQLVDNVVKSIRATPCLFYPDSTEANKGVVIFGYETDFEVTYSTPDMIHASLQVKGLT